MPIIVDVSAYYLAILVNMASQYSERAFGFTFMALHHMMAPIIHQFENNSHAICANKIG